MLRVALALCLVVASRAGAAPVPKSDPTPRAPTAAELVEAASAYREVGGQYYGPPLITDHRLNRPRFVAPIPLTVEAASRLPDLEFDYTLMVTVLSDTPLEAVAALGHLKNLQTVSFDGGVNAKPDQVIPHLRALRAVRGLKRLDCGWNVYLTEASAEVFLGMTQLTELAISESVGDAGLAALARHPTLKEIALGSRQITDAGLSHLALMPNLLALDISGCTKVTERGLQPFAAPARLTSLRLRLAPTGPNNRLLVAVGRIKTLTELRIAYDSSDSAWDYVDADLTPITRLPFLRHLELSWLIFASDNFLGRLIACGELETLALGGKGALTDAGAKSIAKLPNLRQLHFTSVTELTDAGMAALAAAPRLERLVTTNLKGVTDAGVAALGRSKSLVAADLSGDGFTGVGVAALAEGCGPRLIRLSARHMPATDAAITRLARAAPNLQELDLYGCGGLTDACTPALASLNHLKELSVGDTGITRAGVSALAASLPACVVE